MEMPSNMRAITCWTQILTLTGKKALAKEVSVRINFVYESPAQINSADVRIDDTIGKKDTIFGRYSIMHQHRQDPPWTSNFIAGNGGFATDYVIHNQGLALGWTHTFSSTAVNQARY